MAFRIRSIVLAAFWVAVLAAARGHARIDDAALRTRVTELQNGLTVLTLEDPSSPVVSFQMWVRVGSRDETRHTGLAHLFEHMMFRGTDRLPPEEHERLIEGRGGRVNAFTTRDVTVYFEDVTAENLPLVIELEAERLAHLRIVEETLASEREVVLEERRLRTEDRPGGRGFEALFGLAFHAHPYRHPVIGWRSDIEQVSVEVCRRFFRTYYAPNNIVVVVVGDFDADEALGHLERTLGVLEPAREVPRSPTREPEQRGERRAIVHFDARGPLVLAAWHAPPAGHADAEALDLVSQILSAGRSSRLYRKLVYEGQQALSAHGAYSEMLDAGLFYAMAAVRPDGSIDRVEQLLFREIARLGTELVAPEELAKAKRQIEVSLIGGFLTSHGLASRIASDYVTFGRIRPLEERLEMFQAVTAEDLQRVVRTYLVDEKRSVVRVLRPVAGPDAAAGEAP